MVFRGNGDQVPQQMRWISPTCQCRAEVTFIAATAGENDEKSGRNCVASQFFGRIMQSFSMFFYELLHDPSPQERLH